MVDTDHSDVYQGRHGVEVALVSAEETSVDTPDSRAASSGCLVRWMSFRF